MPLEDSVQKLFDSLESLKESFLKETVTLSIFSKQHAEEIEDLDTRLSEAEKKITELETQQKIGLTSGKDYQIKLRDKIIFIIIGWLVSILGFLAIQSFTRTFTKP